ncbi:MAG: hypothetical protein EA397_12665 [Deltaproteobacteria bacterium]|nr:MAG: hypothetical protein EA397_12665 [Deltaproteobacteria bacterium]
MRWFIWLGIGLAACGDGSVESQPNGMGSGSEIPQAFIGYTSRTSDAERRGTSIQVALVRVDVHAADSWSLGEQLAIQTLGGTGNFSLPLPDDPPTEHLGELPFGGTGALYLPVIFDDANRNGLFEERSDDFILGFGEERWLAYAPSAQGDQPAGWSVYERIDEEPLFRALNTQAEVPLWGLSSQPRLSGVLSLQGDPLGVVALDARRFGQGEPSNFVAYNVVPPPETGRFDITVTIRPSAAAFQSPTDAPRFVHMVNMVFEDVNGDGVYTEGTDILRDAALCFDGQRLDLRFTDTPRTIEDARALADHQITSGWRFLVDGEEFNTNALRWVPFGQGCPL